MGWQAWFPVLVWRKTYDRKLLSADLVAACVVTLVLIPQSLAYAQLANMPPAAGLAASMLPLVFYALMGSSSVMAVGPAAVTSLMTGAVLSGLPSAMQTPEIGLWLALFGGLALLLMGILRLGVVAQFISHPVMSGFVSASGVLIIVGQLKYLLGLPLHGQVLPAWWQSLQTTGGGWHGPTAILGLSALLLLWVMRQYGGVCLQRVGLSAGQAALVNKLIPVGVLVLSALLVMWAGLERQGIRVVGEVPAGLPPFHLPSTLPSAWESLILPACLIALVGFVESVSIGQSLAAKRRMRIVPDQELRGLGVANLAAGLCGAFPVTGGFSRSVVSFDAGARTPATGLFTAFGLLAATLWLTPALYYLPQAVLAAMIVVPTLTLIDLTAWGRMWRYAKSDFVALSLTFVATLWFGLEAGLLSGIGASLLMHVLSTSRPHIAVVGQVPGTEHFRNIARHEVLTVPGVLGIRVDESLYFANMRPLEDMVAALVTEHPEVEHVVLLCSAVNTMDASAVESLEMMDKRLSDAGVQLHFSEIKGPVMDRLARSEWWPHFKGKVFLTHYQAVTALAEENGDA